MENSPVFILLGLLILYLIWDWMQWNKILKERKRIFKELHDAFKDFNDSLDRLEKIKKKDEL